MAEITEIITTSPNTTGEDKIQDAQLTSVSSEDVKTDDSKFELEKIREKHHHEQSMIQYGIFGHIFGAEENSSKNLTFVLLLFILKLWFIICLITIFAKELSETAFKMFEILIPLITLSLGYFFGKK